MSRRTKEVVNVLRCYLREVRSFALLEPEEEQCLIGRIEEGRRARAGLDEPQVSPREKRVLGELESRGWEARNQVVRANLRLVVYIARRYTRRRSFRGLRLQLLDLIQEGNVGLLMAVDSLKSGYGKISTFVAPWIRRRIHRAVSEQSHVIRVPGRVHAKLSRLRKEERRYLDEKGRPPDAEELAAELGIDTADLEALRRAEPGVVFLSAPVSDDESGATYEDLVGDPTAAAFDQRTADRQWLAWLLDGLSERSRRVLEWHFGYDLTLGEIGMRENVSRERIRQIKNEALEKVRRRHAADGQAMEPQGR